MGQALPTDQFIKPLGDRLTITDGKIMSSTVSPDGKHLAALTTDQSVDLNIVSLDTYKVQQTVGPATGADLKISRADVGQEGPTYSPDGKFLWMPQTDGYSRFPVNADGTVGAPTFINLWPGTKYGDPQIIEDPSLGQKVATFDGVDDAYAYTLDGSRMTSGFTVECKMRFDGGSVNCDNTEGGGVQLAVYGTSVRFAAFIGGAYQYVSFPQTTQRGWYDVVGTWDGSTQRLYVNGQLVGQQSTIGAYTPPKAGATKLTLGGSDTATGVSPFFPLTAAAARVYSRALNDQQVSDLYINGDKAAVDPGDLLNVDYNDGSGILDSSPQHPLASQAVFTPDGSTVYTALNGLNRVVALDAATGVVKQSWDVGIAPRDMVMIGHKLYVSNEGGRQATKDDTTLPSYGTRVPVDPKTGATTTGTVSVIDTAAPDSPVESIDVGLHPTALYASGGTLFVANTASDTVSVIDSSKNKVVQTIATQPSPSSNVGYEPDGIVATKDGHLLVTLGRANAVGVYRFTRALDPVSYVGLLPTDYFPENIATVGDKIIVTNTRGVDDRAKTTTISKGPGTTPATGGNTHMTTSSLNRFELPEDAVIRKTLTPEVFAQNGWTNDDVKKATGKKAKAVAIPNRLGDPSTIKHVFLVIKENRTYDQVLGDDPRGNGDPPLAQFGENVTPNQHEMAKEFGLYDNMYDIGTNSGEGHSWLLESDNPEYSESEAAEYERGYGPPLDPLDVNRTGFIWDNAKRADKTVRNYGEGVSEISEPAGTNWPNLYCDAKNIDATGADTKYQTDSESIFPSENADVVHDYPEDDLNVPDEYRYEIWKKDFEKIGPADLNLIRLPDNHTGGAPVNPVAQVADNDLALGKFVDTISHSKYWKDSAIFVVEDDTQDGVDHVDGMRGPVQIISPWAQRGVVDSHYYSQLNMIRTIEQILGMQPMNQKDSSATPMFGAFTNKAIYTPYNVVPNRIPLTYGLTTAPTCGYDQVPAQYASAAPAEAPAPAIPASEQKTATIWQDWAKSQPFASHTHAKLDSAPPALMNHYTWYEGYGFTKPYPGDKKILTPAQVPGGVIPGTDSDG